MFDASEWKNWETYYFMQQFREIIENDIEGGVYEAEFKEFEHKMDQGYCGFFEIGEWVIDLIEGTFDPYSSDNPHQEYILGKFVQTIDKREVGEIVFDAMLEYNKQKNLLGKAGSDEDAEDKAA